MFGETYINQHVTGQHCGVGWGSVPQRTHLGSEHAVRTVIAASKDNAQTGLQLWQDQQEEEPIPMSEDTPTLCNCVIPLVGCCLLSLRPEVQSSRPDGSSAGENKEGPQQQVLQGRWVWGKPCWMDQWSCTRTVCPTHSKQVHPPTRPCAQLTCSHFLQQRSGVLTVNGWTVECALSPLSPQELPKAAHQHQHQSRIPAPLPRTMGGATHDTL